MWLKTPIRIARWKKFRMEGCHATWSHFKVSEFDLPLEAHTQNKTIT